MTAARARLRYRFDNTLGRGTAGVIAWLAVITFAFILLLALLLSVTAVSAEGSRDVGFAEAVWLSFTRSLDPGTMADDTTWPFRLTSALVTLGGVFVLTSLIGLVSSGIDRKLDELRKGRSPVLERGHTLVLGWSPKLFPIVSELVIANANQPHACVVVMSSHDKVGMDDAIRERIPDTKGTRIVCRTGDPSDPADLQLVSPHQAKAVIVLCPEEAAGDAQVVRTVLALMTTAARLDRTNVVAELSDPAHARALLEVTQDRVQVVVPSEVIARITAQVCLQPGLSGAYQEFLDFSGHEIYFTVEASLVGRTFGEALLAYERCAVIGVRFADGRVALDPPTDTVVADGDSLIVVAEDDDAVTAAAVDLSVPARRPAPVEEVTGPERFVVVGWNPIGRVLLLELDQRVLNGSSAVVLVDREPGVSVEDRAAVDGLEALAVSWREADTTASESLAEALGDDDVHHVIILSRRDISVAEADARTLMTLLQLRQLIRTLPRRPSVVTELLDVRDVELARTEEADDFVVSEHLSSLMMVQLSENRELAAVFADLFDTEGTDLCLKPAKAYGAANGPAPFMEAVRAARDRGEAVIGYRSKGRVVMNPPKSEPLRLGDEDHLVVLAPGDRGRG